MGIRLQKQCQMQEPAVVRRSESTETDRRDALGSAEQTCWCIILIIRTQEINQTASRNRLNVMLVLLAVPVR